MCITFLLPANAQYYFRYLPWNWRLASMQLAVLAWHRFSSTTITLRSPLVRSPIIWVPICFYRVPLLFMVQLCGKHLKRPVPINRETRYNVFLSICFIYYYCRLVTDMWSVYVSTCSLNNHYTSIFGSTIVIFPIHTGASRIGIFYKSPNYVSKLCNNPECSTGVSIVNEPNM